MTKLAIMQPYFFPYLGYWQLMNAVDRFVIYDDVHYIKGGWINRNRILVHGAANFITMPLRGASSFRRICDIALVSAPRWRTDMLKTLDMAYRKSPCFAEVFPVIEKLITFETDRLAEILAHQLQTLARFMGLSTEFVVSSRRYGNDHLKGAARVLDICRTEGAQTYINAEGGQALYDARSFAAAGVELRFLRMRAQPYPQRSSAFVPGLSIIDVLMALGPHGMNEQLTSCEWIAAA